MLTCHFVTVAAASTIQWWIPKGYLACFESPVDHSIEQCVDESLPNLLESQGIDREFHSVWKVVTL